MIFKTHLFSLNHAECKLLLSKSTYGAMSFKQMIEHYARTLLLLLYLNISVIFKIVYFKGRATFS